MGAQLSKKALNAIPLAIRIIERILEEETGLKGGLDVNCVNARLKSLDENLHYNPVG